MFVRVAEGNYNLLDRSERICNVFVLTPDDVPTANLSVDAGEGAELRELPWGDAAELALSMTTREPDLETRTRHDATSVLQGGVRSGYHRNTQTEAGEWGSTGIAPLPTASRGHA